MAQPLLVGEYPCLTLLVITPQIGLRPRSQLPVQFPHQVSVPDNHD
jgi:hypothetical protein